MKSKQILSLSLAACLTIGSLAGAGEAQAKSKSEKAGIVKNKNDCLYRQDKDIEG